MQKIDVRESRTAFVFQDQPELRLGLFVSENLAELLGPESLGGIDPRGLHSRLLDTLDKVVNQESVPEMEVFRGPEATLMLRGMQAMVDCTRLTHAVPVGGTIRYETETSPDDELVKRSVWVASVLDEYSDPALRVERNARHTAALEAKATGQMTAFIEALSTEQSAVNVLPPDYYTHYI